MSLGQTKVYMCVWRECERGEDNYNSLVFTSMYIEYLLGIGVNPITKNNLIDITMIQEKEVILVRQ